MTSSLRPAEVADLPFVLRSERSYMQTIEPANEQRWTAAIDRNLALWIDCLPRTLVLDVDGEAAGYQMWLPTGDSATLVSIHVVARHRRRGFGRLLLDAFAEQARAAGHVDLCLGVHRDNPAAPIYAAAGYVHTGDDGDYRMMALGTAARSAD
ncbi:GNAT family N-acetyltransferase [Streptomyces sp. SL13]|uniref:GNAT family N-acetyltransferase n=1 Tax=Streptantibioticus silvisoli TaxID=2705255 RepID=A0AA90K1H7_9ACTN|nr:GNAT family N-acetyltransferase [Streptantibioticus silvisoli]MDI5973856.1 GNAT family N-acetyltransferase [Streptantibioticus silvisoli]